MALPLQLQEIGDELVKIVSDLATSLQDFRRSTSRGVVAVESMIEENRTIEFQVLEEDSNEIEFAAFSDGPSGCVGTGGVLDRNGIRFDSSPQRFVGGVPTRGERDEGED